MTDNRFNPMPGQEVVDAVNAYRTTRQRMDTSRPPRRDCVQCGSPIRRGQLGKVWPTGAMSCRLCYDADFGL